ncbi:DUF4221 domain-containing protein [Aquiflexum gelatinilyticum]|uniref:DUF4221 domain-containing protein n=1 Tax=Aquiflexum gelatinilyticum TaxID=2961943 RepID=A0A9X2P419_9BACT|nr:DUF4221 domain-containing protein [Aquiflexum gelatinilyticum]MCR9013708.1 DUF4221 domain-containing protein [Aquiflexum gelatinilyticum]
MKKHIYLFSPIFLLLFLSINSCNSVEEKSQEKHFTLKSTGEFLSLPLDENTPNVSMGLQYSQGFLFNANWGKNEIQVYDIEAGSMIKSLIFDKEGDQGVGQLFGFHVHSLDSIFLFSQLDAVLVLTDTSGLVKNRIRYQQPDLYSPAFVHNSYFLSPPIVKGDEIFVKTHFQGNYREVTAEQLSTYHLAYAVNMKTGSVRFLKHTYPFDYLSGGLKHFEPSMATDGEKVVYSLFGDHRLFFSFSFEEDLQAVSVASTHLDESLPLFPMQGERFDTQKYMQGSSRYESLIYDPFREVYYRFAFPTYTFESDEEIRSLRTEPREFVIMTLDKELKIIDDQYFEGRKYMPNNVFVGEKGLYISTSHPNNPENQEDKMVFEIFGLEEK